MKEFYIFQTEGQANACLNYINNTPWFPIVPEVNGVPAPDRQQGTKWLDAPIEMISGEWAVPRIKSSFLDYVGVPMEERQAFINNFGQDIRELGSSSFPEFEEELN